MKKYEILYDTCREIRSFGQPIKVYRIRALIDFDDVSTGDVGGWISDEKNLSHDGKCWIYNKAIAFGDSQILDNAKIYGISRVFGNSIVSDNARVFHRALVYGSAKVFGNAIVGNCAKVYDNSEISDSAQIIDSASIYQNAKVKGFSIVSGVSQICANADISKNEDLLSFIDISTMLNDTCYTVFKCRDGITKIKCDDFLGSKDELIEFFEAKNPSKSLNDRDREVILNLVDMFEAN